VSLLKRGGLWWSYFYIDGIRHQNPTGTANKRQAQAIEQKLKEEANAHRHQLVNFDPQLTVGAVAARFLADGQAKPHHIYQLKALLPFFGDLPVARLTRNLAREYRKWRKGQKPVTDSTVNRALSVLRHLLYWGVDESILPANPMARVPLVREGRLRRPVMTLHEEDRLLQALPEYLRRITIAALDTGMRRGEVLHQRWEHVDLSRRLLSVTKSKTIEGEAREIPLTARLFDLLAADPQSDGVIFTYRGKPLSWIRKGWLAALKRAGLRHFRFHDLRHTFNTRLMEAGVLQEVRMALMGHSSGEKVHSIYTHVELPVKREAITRLEQWVLRQRQQQGGTHSARTETAGTTDRQTATESGGAKTLEKENTR
jgi:integrase